MVGVTTIEDRAAVGPFSHIAHDNTIGAGAVLTAQCALGGYVRLGPKAMAGIGTRIHQRLVVGALTMTGMGAVVVQHLVPGITVVGVPARLTGVNRVGLRRTGLSDKHIAQWADAMASGVVPADHPMIDELRVFQEYVMASTTTKGVIPPNPWIIR
jgi:UDP-N-acetylglucosamine acyltransferase